MADTHEITIEDFEFPIEPAEIRAGDSVVWINNDPEPHTATSFTAGIFDTGEIDAGARSAPIVFNAPSDQSGIDYFCDFHPGMTGKIFVKEAAVNGEYPENDWVSIGQKIAANWVYDMADDFDHALQTNTGGDLKQVTESWTRVSDWWTAQVGAGKPILNRSVLVDQTRELLENLGRRLKQEHEGLRQLVRRHPVPNHPGQSNDSFGKAITIFAAGPEIGGAYSRQIRYVIAAFRIELLQDAGQSVPATQIAAYHTAKGNVTPEDYRLLAAHQTSRLRALFGADAFDGTKFDESIWRMTLDGEWDQPTFSLWHWLRWVDAYLGVVRTGQIPNIVTLP